MLGILNWYWLDLSCPIVRTLIVLLIVAVLTVISILKFYVYISCGFYREKVKMDGKTVIITGANGGIGKETAKEIAKRGAKVIMACRNEISAKKARDEIVDSTKNENIIVKQLDLSSQKSIRKFAEEIIRTEQRIDVLIHNAATSENSIKMTEDNLETTMATNYFGPFLLTHLLIDLIKRSAPSRIVIVGSELYRLCSLNLDNLNPQRHWFPLWLYYPSKYAIMLFSNELARRLDGTGVTVNCLHPGLIDSGIWRNVPVPLNWPLKLIVKGFFKNCEQGCQTSVYLACSEDIKDVTGKYFMDCREKSLSSGASDPNKAKKLWELTEKFVNLKTDDPKI